MSAYRELMKKGDTDALDLSPLEFVLYVDAKRITGKANGNSTGPTLSEACEELATLRSKVTRLQELVCVECGSRVMDSGYCMMGHWCGKPLR